MQKKKINGYINNFLSPYLALLSLTKKWKKGFR